MITIKRLLGLPVVIHPPKFGTKSMRNISRSGATACTPDDFAMAARIQRLRRELKGNK